MKTKKVRNQIKNTRLKLTHKDPKNPFINPTLLKSGDEGENIKLGQGIYLPGLGKWAIKGPCRRLAVRSGLRLCSPGPCPININF
jgi:hypothetical protein